ncbi:hypothetical protein AO501_24875 [Mycobacterium gordonae]|uniref:MFS transporter n=1 Tax=Mycobacterium gordonae TaxID=1778 RepID=A0A0Q2X228_MYCGO|nr:MULTISPECIES: hypothetical protein [Mycobacterium]KQH75524.1 hypothetical protein AO501_24875 [Mycobacterium gordonae]MDP7732169.1 hypothetical protein [Mycobacterium sp. TY813]
MFQTIPSNDPFESRTDGYAAEGGSPSNRCRQLLTYGCAYGSSIQLCSVSAVLPILCAKFGSAWAAGLVFPLFSIAMVAGFAASPLVLGRASHLRHLVLVGGCASMGALIACAAFAAEHRVFVDAVFLVVATGMGVVRGICDGTYRELVAAMLPAHRQGALILTECAVSAVIIVFATLLVVPALSGPGDRELTVLSIGAASMFAASAAGVLIGAFPVRSGAVVPRFGDAMRRTSVIVTSQPAFRKYAIAQAIFIPISLSPTFYALHAPTDGGHSNLSAVIVSSAVGLLVGAVLWRVVHRAAGIRGMLIGSTGMAVAAGVVCVAAHLLELWPQTWVHGLVFALTAAGNQALLAASTEWLGTIAKERDRAILIGFTAAIAALLRLVLGAGMYAAAQQTNASWPVMMLLALEVVAVAAALQGTGRRRPASSDRRRASVI